MSEKVVLSVGVPEEMAEEFDKKIADRFVSRSDALRTIIREWLKGVSSRPN